MTTSYLRSQDLLEAKEEYVAKVGQILGVLSKGMIESIVAKYPRTGLH